MIAVGGIDEVYPGIARRADDRRALAFVGAVAEIHRPEADLRDLEPAGAQHSIFHGHASIAPFAAFDINPHLPQPP
jgi:hypothetical protein